MTRYGIRLYAHTDELCARYVECGKKEIPRMLARFVLDYIKDALYPGAMTATVSAGSDMFLYIIKIIDDTVTVYHQVFQRNIADVDK